MNRVDVKRDLIFWAIRRSGRSEEHFREKFAWIGSGEKLTPTVGQISTFAKDARVPLGFLFLSSPPEESVPLPDFRRVADAKERSPSPELLDTIYACQLRQSWFRDYAQKHDLDKPAFIGRFDTKTSVNSAAEELRDWLEFDPAERQFNTWTEALSDLIHRCDDAGVLSMVNGIVGNNTHRRLNPQEFRGFAICDEFAPLIFVNAADTKSAQMFTIVHEVAHIWLGKSALSDSGPEDKPLHAIEKWCDAVAAEFLVPESTLKKNIKKGEEVQSAIERLSRFFKVSTLVALRRLFDVGYMTEKIYWQTFNEERTRLLALLSERKGSGGDFYRTSNFRVSRRFARALITSTLEGETLYGDAMRLLAVSSSSVIESYAEHLGIIDGVPA